MQIKLNLLGGGEAIDIAIRLARASSKKDKIIFSGYHGWYDWYLATNIKGNNKLKDHLLQVLIHWVFQKNL